jgi:hypothetical protein
MHCSASVLLEKKVFFCEKFCRTKYALSVEHLCFSKETGKSFFSAFSFEVKKKLLKSDYLESNYTFDFGPLYIGALDNLLCNINGSICY